MSSKKNNEISTVKVSEQPVKNECSPITDRLLFVCPICGSEQVRKSIGGMIEHVAAVGAVKLAKSALLGDYSCITGGAENEIIKDEVPLQQVCNYCHHTFHARRSQIEAGQYSMIRSKADELMEKYNEKLQWAKDEEVDDLRSQASGYLGKAFIYALVFGVGLLICLNCEHETEGFLGMKAFTWTYMFSWVVMLLGGGVSVMKFFSWMELRSNASEIENLTIQEYAKNHSV